MDEADRKRFKRNQFWMSLEGLPMSDEQLERFGEAYLASGQREGVKRRYAEAKKRAAEEGRDEFEVYREITEAEKRQSSRKDSTDVE